MRGTCGGGSAPSVPPVLPANSMAATLQVWQVTAASRKLGGPQSGPQTLTVQEPRGRREQTGAGEFILVEETKDVEHSCRDQGEESFVDVCRDPFSLLPTMPTMLLPLSVRLDFVTMLARSTSCLTSTQWRFKPS